MKIYTFVYGVDGFGADTSPAYEEGVFLNREKAFARQKELNHHLVYDRDFYEEGWGEDYWPNDNELCNKLDFEENWDALDEEIDKHRVTDLDEICRLINEMDEPPFNWYQMVEYEVIE